MSCYVKTVNNSRKSEIKCLLQGALELFSADFPLCIVRNISSEYARLQSTSQQEMSPYSIEKLVSLFDEINDTMSQNLLQVSTEKNIALLIAGCLPYKEKRMSLLGSVDTSKRN